jgi:dihydrofolate synthase/folylpolyglutamate synthase
MRLGLLGRHQAANASVALGILGGLERAGTASATDDQIQRGFANARWPGRMELIDADGDRPEVLLDGAHNAHGATALAASLDELLRDNESVTLLLGVVRDKDVAAVIGALRSSQVLQRASVITTNVPDTERSSRAADLANLWPGARAIVDADEALEAALERGRMVVVAGSLYLVGHVRARLLGLEKD